MSTRSGIYTIQNTVSGQIYVGSAVCLRDRWTRHRRELNNQDHRNTKLQRSWNKYGETVFEFNVVQEVLDKHELITWEQFWIDKLNPYFNILRIANSHLGCVRSDASKLRMSAGQIGRIHSQQTREKIGNSSRGREVTSETRARISASTIANYEAMNQQERQALSERRKKARPIGSFHQPLEARQKMSAARAKTYSLLSPAGEVVVVTNLSKWCALMGLNKGNMNQVALGRLPSCKGWRIASAS